MSESFEELSARARRGELSRAEQERLRLYLNASLEARLWHEAGCQSDVEGALRPGDHDAVERVMRRALVAVPPRRGRRLGAPLSLAAAAVFFVASVAAASVVGIGYFRERKLWSPPVAHDARAKRAVGASLGRVAPPVVATPPAPAPGVIPAEAPVVVTAPAVSGLPSPARTASAAAELFSAAARARREGNAAKAITLLESLQDQHPASREARLSDLTLGSLHLKRGAVQVALRHFDGYTRSSPQGPLAPEAFWGQYRALSALGRPAEARARLQLLAERFPGSTYAGVARAKLNAEPRRP